MCVDGWIVATGGENTVSLNNDHYVMAVKCHVRLGTPGTVPGWVAIVGILHRREVAASIQYLILYTYSVPARDPTSHKTLSTWILSDLVCTSDGP